MREPLPETANPAAASAETSTTAPASAVETERCGICDRAECDVIPASDAYQVAWNATMRSVVPNMTDDERRAIIKDAMGRCDAARDDCKAASVEWTERCRIAEATVAHLRMLLRRCAPWLECVEVDDSEDHRALRRLRAAVVKELP